MLRDSGQTPAPAMTAEQAARLAAQACAHMLRVEELVGDNASVEQVRQALRDAERTARRAAQGDATWLALAGGVSSVRLAVEADDERVARTGIDVVRTECRRAR